MAKKKIGTLIREILWNLTSEANRERLADRLDEIEASVDRVGDLVRGRDDDAALSVRLDAIEARLDRLEKPKRAARRALATAAQEG